ncbi:MAG: hypothetical protein BWZ10_01374 [candidate division BRC1 bacterium ADurb.BinA364]|nr:MAG: hypothetical protein BWZ10_01374 [candidate division BRC1 bacterium ADurb.BinA364]
MALDEERPADGSFRDPSGYVFHRNGELLRRINPSYRDNYQQLMASGLYDALVRGGLLVPHAEVGAEPGGGLVIRPEYVDFVAYPYEWCFSQLQDAALATLAIQKAALSHEMTLKDASAYNMQFHRGRPVLIDTLSFARRVPGAPWGAYRQFCQHFLAPLALMSLNDIRLGQLFRLHIDGIPLDLAAALLPRTSWLRPALLLHLHLHAKSQRHFAERPLASLPRRRAIGTRAALGLLDSLQSAIRRLRWRPNKTQWANYYATANYADEAMAEKKRLVGEFLRHSAPRTVWDLGANTGAFSRIAAEHASRVIALDSDPGAVDINYRQCRRDGDEKILPLAMDLTNPSPGIGWMNMERKTLLSRGPADAALALALVHHLAISNNLPFEAIADGFARMCRDLIVEYVPKEDSQAQRLLYSREDVFDRYTQNGFEQAFAARFDIVRTTPIPGTLRTLYYMRQKR